MKKFSLIVLALAVFCSLSFTALGNGPAPNVQPKDNYSNMGPDNGPDKPGPTEPRPKKKRHKKRKKPQKQGPVMKEDLNKDFMMKKGLIKNSNDKKEQLVT
jgi:hypothetical protein